MAASGAPSRLRTGRLRTSRRVVAWGATPTGLTAEPAAQTRAAGLRHLTLNAMGQGQRDVRVSYISEVPVWKATYRLVFPRDGKGNAVLQGWAVVDNTVGADWDNVQLALVAGAPQSFIQPLSQPLYARRPEIPISTSAMTTPQTHEAANAAAVDMGCGLPAVHICDDSRGRLDAAAARGC